MTSTKPNPKKSRRSLQITLAFASTLFSLGLVEIVCQLMWSPPPSMRFEQDLNELHGMGLHGLAGAVVNDEELFWRLAPDLELRRTGSPIFGRVSNRAGLREENDISLIKPDGQRRILFLGDSCTFGYGLDLSEGFVDRTEKTLAKEYSQENIECINAGVPGYSLFQGWRFLETKGLDYQPDVVVMCFGWNDRSMWDGSSDFDHYERSNKIKPPEALRWSKFCRMIWPTFVKKDAQAQGFRPRLNADEFRDLLNRTLDTTRDKNIELVVLIWGVRFQTDAEKYEQTEHQKELHSFADSNQLTKIDLVPLFRKLVAETSGEAVYLDQGHATASANNAIADVLSVRLHRLLNDDRQESE